jgi:hypothetical protein
MHTEFWWGNLLQNVHLEDRRNKDGSFKEVGWEVDVAQDHVQWQTFSSSGVGPLGFATILLVL